MLRLAPPGDDVACEAAALRHWNGHGVVELYDVDVQRRTLLLERLDSDRTLQTEPILRAITILGELTQTMAIPAPANTGWRARLP